MCASLIPAPTKAYHVPGVAAHRRVVMPQPWWSRQHTLWDHRGVGKAASTKIIPSAVHGRVPRWKDCHATWAIQRCVPRFVQHHQDLELRGSTTHQPIRAKQQALDQCEACHQQSAVAPPQVPLGQARNPIQKAPLAPCVHQPQHGRAMLPRTEAHRVAPQQSLRVWPLQQRHWVQRRAARPMVLPPSLQHPSAKSYVQTL
mmetsp:Transcript_104381/g.207292  ORF Transcript_104381/g.207292 Transcript_104381/m.207292 type:complete len:201 (-) Transcript_104381:722-1324(-)